MGCIAIYRKIIETNSSLAERSFEKEELGHLSQIVEVDETLENTGVYFQNERFITPRIIDER